MSDSIHLPRRYFGEILTFLYPHIILNLEVAGPLTENRVYKPQNYFDITQIKRLASDGWCSR